MLKKELRIQVKAETQDFDRTVDSMQRRLKQMTSGPEAAKAGIQTKDRAAALGIGTGATEGERRRADQMEQQAMRRNEQYIRDQVKQQDSINKALANRLQQLKEIEDKQKNVVKGSEEELKLMQQKQRLEQSAGRLQQVSAGKAAGINQALDIRQAGMPMPAQQASLAQTLGRVAGAVGGAIAISEVVSETVKYIASTNRETSSIRTGASESLVGRRLDSVFQNRGFIDNAFLGERSRAIDMSLSENAINRKLDPLSGISNVFRGGIQTLLSPITGSSGGTGTLLNGLSQMFGNKENLSQILGGISPLLGAASSMMPDSMFGGPLSKRYSAFDLDRTRTLIEENTRNEEMRDPLKRRALEAYGSQMQGDLDFQRSMGMNNYNFRMADQGFLNRGMNQGFTREQLMGASMNIMAAGGGTDVSRRGAVLSNQLTRNFDLTNASGLLGTLGRTTGNLESSENQLVKILAEGTRLGLDQSQFVEENRRFAQAAVQLIASTGTQDASSAGRLSSLIANAMPDRTIAGIDAASGAVQKLTGLTGAGGGTARQVIQRSAALNDDVLRSMAGTDRLGVNQLMEMDRTQLTSDNPIIQGLVAQYNQQNPNAPITPEDLIARTNKAKETGMTVTKFADQAKGKIMKMMEGGKSLDEVLSTPEGMIAQKDLLSGLNIEGVTGKSNTEQKALARAFINQGAAGVEEQMKVQERLAQGTADTTGRIEDQSMAAIAKEQQLVNQAINDYRKDIVEAASATRAMSKAMFEAAERLDRVLKDKSATAEQGAEAISKYRDALITQPQAGPGNRPGNR